MLLHDAELEGDSWLAQDTSPTVLFYLPMTSDEHWTQGTFFAVSSDPMLGHVRRIASRHNSSENGSDNGPIDSSVLLRNSTFRTTGQVCIAEFESRAGINTMPASQWQGGSGRRGKASLMVSGVLCRNFTVQTGGQEPVTSIESDFGVHAMLPPSWRDSSGHGGDTGVMDGGVLF